MFKVVFMVFAIHGGVAEPLQAFRNKQDFATEKACTTFMASKEFRKSRRKVEKELTAMDEKLKAKFACVKEEEEKSEDDGSI